MIITNANWMDRWVERWADRRVHGRMDVQMSGSVGAWMVVRHVVGGRTVGR